MSRRDWKVNGARSLSGVRPALERQPAWPTPDQMTLATIAETWGAYYHLEYDEGAYTATRPDGFTLPQADSPESLDSVIRADFSRWGSR